MHTKVQITKRSARRNRRISRVVFALGISNLNRFPLSVASVWLIRHDKEGRPSPSCLFELIGLIQHNKEGRPSPSCLFDLFNATRRGDPPRRVCLTYSMRWGGSPLPVVYGFYLMQWGGKPSPSRLFDLIWCDEGLPSPSHLFHVIQCGKGGKPSCYVFHLIRLITYIVNSKDIDITPKRPVLTG